MQQRAQMGAPCFCLSSQRQAVTAIMEAQGFSGERKVVGNEAPTQPPVSCPHENTLICSQVCYRGSCHCSPLEKHKAIPAPCWDCYKQLQKDLSDFQPSGDTAMTQNNKRPWHLPSRKQLQKFGKFGLWLICPWVPEFLGEAGSC